MELIEQCQYQLLLVIQYHLNKVRRVHYNIIVGEVWPLPVIAPVCNDLAAIFIKSLVEGASSLSAFEIGVEAEDGGREGAILLKCLPE